MYGYGAYPKSKFQLAIKEKQKFISLPSFSFTLIETVAAETNRAPIFAPALHRERWRLNVQLMVNVDPG